MNDGISAVLAACIVAVGGVVGALVSQRRSTKPAGPKTPLVIINVVNGYPRRQPGNSSNTRLPGQVSRRDNSKLPRRST